MQRHGELPELHSNLPLGFSSSVDDPCRVLTSIQTLGLRRACKGEQLIEPVVQPVYDLRLLVLRILEMAGAMAARIAAGEVKCISRCLGGAALRGELRHKEMLQNVCTTHRNMFDVFEDCKVTPCNSDRCGSTCLKGVIPCQAAGVLGQSHQISSPGRYCAAQASLGGSVSASLQHRQL